MRIAVAAERVPGETRVALVPESIARLRSLGAQVRVEPGAGALAGFADQAYRDAGAGVERAAMNDADVVVSVQPIAATDLERLRPGAATISFFTGPARSERVAALRQRQIRAFAMEQVPRLSRAQPMDALTSQALVAGYRAVIVAAELYPRFFGPGVTAAGTVPPARVLVLGAGVAGLQAIATARRLGAEVSGFDVRASSAEEIASLGAIPIDLGLPPLTGAAGYAREMTPERAVAQQRLLEPHVVAADVVITTAAVPGRRAPVLITAEMITGMRAGSVIVDITAEFGGNVAGVRPGELLRPGKVLLWGGANVPASMPTLASELYSQNVAHLIALMTRGGVFAPDLSDEIVAGALVAE